MPFKRKIGVYKITNINNKKVYVGSSINLLSRQADHFRKLQRGIHKNRKLQNAFNKHGKEAFIFEILEYLESSDNLLEREQYYIDLYDSAKSGYNILSVAGNSLGYKHSKEIRKGISMRQMGSGNFFFGKHLTEEHKLHISQGNKGKKHSKEAVDKTRKGHFKPILNVETQREYEYISIAAEELGVSVTAISNVLRGKAQTCKGFHWVYKGEDK